MHSVFEGAPVTFVPADCLACAPATITLLCMNFQIKFIILIVYARWTYEYCPVCSNWSLNPLCYWKAAHVQYISCSTVWPGLENGFGVENGFCIGNWISINLFEFVHSIGWKENISVLANIGQSELFVDVRLFVIYEQNNRQHSSRKLLFLSLLYQYPSEAWKYRLASCTQCRRRKTLAK